METKGARGRDRTHRPVRWMRPTTIGWAVVLATWAAIGPLAGPALALGNCSNESTGNIPLQDLVGGSYEGIPGGLYPGGTNTMPDDHLAWGLELASQVEPLDAFGNPDPAGSSVFLTVGMSNAEIESPVIFDSVAGSPGAAIADRLVFVNGAKGGRDADKMSDLSLRLLGRTGRPGHPRRSLARRRGDGPSRCRSSG